MQEGRLIANFGEKLSGTTLNYPTYDRTCAHALCSQDMGDSRCCANFIKLASARIYCCIDQW